MSRCWIKPTLGPSSRHGRQGPPEKADIRGGDKLALRTIERDGKICCILLAKTDELGQAAQATLGLDEEKVLRLAGAVSSITVRVVKP